MPNAARSPDEDENENDAVIEWPDEVKPKHIDPARLAEGVWLMPVGLEGGPAFTVARTREVDGRRVIDGLILIDPDITAATLRKLPFSVLTAMSHLGLALREDQSDRLAEALDSVLPYILEPPDGFPERPRLTRPDGTDPAGFSRRVAAAYGEALIKTSTPAKLLAEEAGVPVTTVHRWVRDARRLGYLPPARKGRAG